MIYTMGENSGDILLFGATGFLGIHVLKEILDSEKNSYIYCIVRKIDSEEPRERLLNAFHFYFGNTYSEMFNNRIKVISGDLKEKNFGLSYEEYLRLGTITSKVVHCGATVKHFGKKDDFYKINVDGTKRVVEFCMNFNKYLIFTSSIAVLEKLLSDGGWKYRQEKLSDDYVKSKIKAEQLIVDYGKRGLRFTIVRIGALTGRYSDGVFQRNIKDNAVYARLKTILQSRCLPSVLLEKKIEFLPVDCCAKTMNQFIANEKQGIYLLYNYNTITYKKLMEYFVELGYFIKVKEYQNLEKYLREMSLKGLNREAISGFYLQMRRKWEKNWYDKSENNNIMQMQFSYPVIDKTYIEKIVDYMVKVNFIKTNTKKYVNYNSCKVYFGSNVIKDLSNAILEFGDRVLFVYGEKSIVENGIYKQITEQLNKGQIKYIEYGGISSNPTVELIEKGIDVGRRYDTNVILAVGGGSVIDCGKAIAAGICSEKGMWELVEDNTLISNVIPVISVLTIFGSGSESDGICSVTNAIIPSKRGITHEKLIPKVAFLDPEYISTVPIKQLTYGIVDMISHLLEQYFQETVLIETQNNVIAVLLKKCFMYGKRLMQESDNEETIINLMYIANNAMNGRLYSAEKEDWSLHPIEHQLTAYYNIPHGMGIGILLPTWLKAIFKPDSYKKFYQYGIDVWDIDREIEEQEVGKMAIDKTIEFLTFLKIPNSLRNAGINDMGHFNVMAEKAYRTHISTSYLALTKNEIYKIYKNSF